MERKLRIVSLLTNLCIGGDPNRLLAFSRALDRSRFDHVVLVIADPSDASHRERGRMLPQFLEHGIRVESLHEPERAAQRGDGWAGTQAWREARAFARIVRRLADYFLVNGTDIVDARMSYAVLFGAIAGRMAHVPVIVATEYGPEFWHGPLRGAAGQLAYGLVDALVSDSRPKVLDHEAWLWRRHLRTAVIPNGIQQPEAHCTRRQMRDLLRMPDDPDLKVIAQVSRVVPEKGHGILIEAAARVFAADPHAVLLVCGYPHPPGYLDELTTRAAALGIRDRVFFISYPGPVADVWAAVDLHVHASLYDSAPIAIHESLALGLPSVVTRVGGIPDMVVEGETSLIVEPGDAAALAEALLRVLHEPGLAARMGLAARQHHLAHYGVQRMTREIEDLFIDLYLNSPRRSGRDEAPPAGAGGAVAGDGRQRARPGATGRAVQSEPPSCAVCGGRAGKPACRKGAYTLLQCACGAMYLDPAVPADAVDHAFDSHPDSFYALPARAKVRWLRGFRREGRLLEVGCGDGHFLRAAQAAGFEVCGIELHEDRVARLRGALNANIECAPVEQARWPAASCDIVYHCDLLSHFPDPLAALTRMADLLRTDGVLFFEVGILGELETKWFDAVPERSIPRHRWFFSERSLHALLARAGLQIVRIKTFGLGPQVILQDVAGRVLRSVRHAGNARGAPDSGTRREAPLRARFDNFMRFTIGAWFPRYGPRTAFVIACRRPGSAP